MSDWELQPLFRVAGTLLAPVALLWVVTLLATSLVRLGREIWLHRSEKQWFRLRMDRAQEEYRVAVASSEHWAGWRQFEVEKKVSADKSGDSCSLYLAPHDGKSIGSFLPGQFLTFRLNHPGCDKPLVRCYSLSDAPSKENFRVIVKRVGPPEEFPKVEPGKASAFIHDQLEVGSILDVKAPAGQFMLDISRRQPTVLIAAGVGVTPFLSMLSSIAQSENDSEVWLFYGARGPSDVIEASQLLELAESNSNFHLVFSFSKSTSKIMAQSVSTHFGRIDLDLLKRYLPSNN